VLASITSLRVPNLFIKLLMFLLNLKRSKSLFCSKRSKFHAIFVLNNIFRKVFSFSHWLNSFYFRYQPLIEIQA
jgi:hypothetical protein